MGWLVGHLVVGAEERVASFTLGLVLVDELVEAVEVLDVAAVGVVPPVADEVLLVEDGPVGAEEAVGGAVGLAHVEGLRTERPCELLCSAIISGDTTCKLTCSSSFECARFKLHTPLPPSK